MVPSKTDAEKLNDIIFEGVFYTGFPAALALVGATYYMRGRARRLVSTTAEHIVLSGLQYYGAFSVGFSLGMLFYGPYLERKVLERMPESSVAAAIRDRRPQN